MPNATASRFAWGGASGVPEVSQCLRCAHKFANAIGCTAFPGGIPDTILLGRHDRRTPHVGDNGITFKPREEVKS